MHGESHDSSANCCGAQMRPAVKAVKSRHSNESDSHFAGNRVIIPAQHTRWKRSHEKIVPNRRARWRAALADNSHRATGAAIVGAQTERNRRSRSAANSHAANGGPDLQL